MILLVENILVYNLFLFHVFSPCFVDKHIYIYTTIILYLINIHVYEVENK